MAEKTDPVLEVKLRRIKRWLIDDLLEDDRDIITDTGRQCRADPWFLEYWHNEAKQGRNAIGALLAHGMLKKAAA
ncbi:MAG: hypothetical protein LBE75_03050 [Burkholderiales bacterium]|nr:hypothetical protein [Burkholderiales bacterium]